MLTDTLSAAVSASTTGPASAKQTTSSPFSAESPPKQPAQVGDLIQEEGAPSLTAPPNTTQSGSDRRPTNGDDSEAPNSAFIESLQNELIEQEAQRREDLNAQRDETFKRNLKLSFTVDEETGTNVFQLIDEETGETVRRYPPEEFLNFIKNFKDVSGLILREDA
ncbi:Flagellar protein FlaG [Acanthopleuribacter pedis]